MSKFTLFFKKILGISNLERQLDDAKLIISRLENGNSSIKNKVKEVESLATNISQENAIIKQHIKFLNSNFSVVSDISDPRYEPSVVIVMYNGKEQIVKTFRFNNTTIQEIYSILEGFGKDSNRIDKPRGFGSPRFRY